MKVGAVRNENTGLNKIIATLFILVAFIFSDPAIPNYQSGREYQVKVHDINQVEMSVSNYGMFGKSEEGNDGCWWPKGSNHWYIEGAGAWFGTIDPATNDTLVTIGYGPHDPDCTEHCEIIAYRLFDSVEDVYHRSATNTVELCLYYEEESGCKNELRPNWIPFRAV